jgi:hypothetical protein
MRQKDSMSIVLFVGLVILTVYVIVNKNTIIKEHLTSGPPTLFTLQKDVKETDDKITKLQKEFEDMKAQAGAQAQQAAAAKAQLTALKQS